MAALAQLCPWLHFAGSPVRWLWWLWAFGSPLPLLGGGGGCLKQCFRLAHAESPWAVAGLCRARAGLTLISESAGMASQCMLLVFGQQLLRCLGWLLRAAEHTVTPKERQPGSSRDRQMHHFHHLPVVKISP